MRAAKEAKPRGKEIPLSSLPGTKKKEKIKYEPDTMVIMPAVPAESVAQYSLALPSLNKDRMLDEMDMLRNITGHLNEIVSTMEGVYAKGGATKEEGEEEEEEEPETFKEDHEEMTSFLICCSQLNNQLETALREEKQILESLLKWFEKEVHEMEEISVEQLIPDWEIPVADKNITDNITKLLTRIERLEELKGRVQELPKLIQLSAPKPEKRKPLGPAPPVPKDPKTIIEELAMKHATEDVMNMVQVFQDDTGQPQTAEMMNNRMLEIMKVFERQTNKLHRVANEQDVLEGKLQKIQQEFRKLAEEKQIMEDELQKMKASETQDKLGPDARKKALPKIEKAKVEEKPAVPERIPTLRQKEHLKMKEDLAKANANIQSLENEKKMLEEKLQKVLEEAQKAKGQLAEIPPRTPDWQFPYTAIVEDDKDVPKKGKKSTKSKGKGEDRTDLRQMSGTAADRAVSKQQKAETGKAGEILPGKSQDISETKDVKLKGRGSIRMDTEKLSGAQDSLTLLEKLTDKKEESKKTKAKIEGKSETVDSKGLPKSKESAEIKRGRSGIKGAGKEAPERSHLKPLPPVQEKQQLPESTDIREETLALDKSPEEMLSPDSERQKTEIMPTPEVSIKEGEDKLPVSEEKASPLLSEFEMDASVGLEETMGESEMHPSLTVVPAPVPTMIIEGTLPAAVTSEEALVLEKEVPIIHTDSQELREDAVRDLISKNMVQLADHLTEMKGMPEAETLAKLLLEPGKGMEELSDRQKLQLLNELITPDELQKVDEKIKGLQEQRKHLTALLETNEQNLLRAQSYAPRLADESSFQGT
ncbi:coiled-coil domain-containing protein 7 [Sceloporus undulatus]|uniref:coiled-coil domain-containing protein 7 n=1 Tax=Sceloporus undulatus TaxID=8520 RepID=UPI001C4D8741|nr:coiled-coil domain-containing protein 7 [Sceloporus undulatus]